MTATPDMPDMPEAPQGLDGAMVLALPQPLPGLPVPVSFRDVAVFAQETARSAGTSLPLEQLAIELGDLVEAGRIASPDTCTFDLEVPGLGRLEGRLQIRRSQADLELHALRPATAASLRQRQRQLQQMVDRESGGDVSLTIV